MTRSDHHSLLATVQLEAQPRRATHWNTNAHWLSEASPEIHRVWLAAPPRSSFFFKLCRITRFYHGFCKARAVVFWADEEELVRALEEANQHAQADPTNIKVMTRRGDHRLRLESLQARKLAD